MLLAATAAILLSCSQQVELAEMAMTARQYGIPRSDIFYGNTNKIVDKAYQSAIMSKHSEKKLKIDSFVKQVQQSCKIV